MSGGGAGDTGGPEAWGAVLFDLERAVDHVDQPRDRLVHLAQVGQLVIFDMRKIGDHQISGDLRLLFARTYLNRHGDRSVSAKVSDRQRPADTLAASDAGSRAGAFAPRG